MSDTSLENIIKIRNKLWASTSIIDEYVKKNPDNLNSEELNIVKEYKKYKAGDFVIVDTLGEYAILRYLEEQESNYYKVSGINYSLQDCRKYKEMYMTIEIVLIPFKGKIIYDSVLLEKKSDIMDGFIDMLKEEYSLNKDKLVEKL